MFTLYSFSYYFHAINLFKKKTKTVDFNNTYFPNDTILENGFHYPKPIDINTIQWNSYKAPKSESNGYLKSFIDTLTNALITRIGDRKAFQLNGQQVGHNYATNSVWNSNGSLLKLNMSPARILNDDDYSVAYIKHLPSQSQWSSTNPELIYGIQNKNEFVSHNIKTNKKTILNTFSNYTNISIGDGKGSQDRQDKHIVFIGTNENKRTLILYDIQLNIVKATKDISPYPKLSAVSISPNGKFIVVAWHTNGSENYQGFKAYDINLENERHLYNDTEHHDLGVDINGDDVIVSFANKQLWKTSHFMVMIRIKDGKIQPLFKDEGAYPKGVWGGHISCRNTKRDGWAYVSEGGASDNVLTNELFAIKLDYSGENLIERYGKHHTNSTLGYHHQARATVNPEGTKICFDSNWNDLILKAWTHAPAWILEYPQD